MSTLIVNGMETRDLRLDGGWSSGLRTTNDIVITLLQRANAHNFFAVQWFELTVWIRDVSIGAQMMCRMAQCSQSWNRGLRTRLLDLRNILLILRLCSTELPEAMRWPACWRQLAADMRNV